MPPPLQGGLLLQVRVLLGLEFYEVYLPLKKKVDILQAIGGGFSN